MKVVTMADLRLLLKGASE